jgi:hypothetical protein
MPMRATECLSNRHSGLTGYSISKQAWVTIHLGIWVRQDADTDGSGVRIS